MFILLTFGICAPDALIHEVMRVPSLAVHYYHHLTAHGKIGVIDFLVLHYGDSQHMKTDAHEHTNLPGTQKQNQCRHSTVIPVVITSTQINFNHPQPNTIKHFAYFHIFLPASASSAIWQPPKLA